MKSRIFSLLSLTINIHEHAFSGEFFDGEINRQPYECVHGHWAGYCQHHCHSPIGCSGKKILGIVTNHVTSLFLSMLGK